MIFGFLPAILRAVIFIVAFVVLTISVFGLCNLVQFVGVPSHEISHIIAIKAVEFWSGKPLEIVEYRLFNADLSSFESFCISIVAMCSGEMSLGYVRCPIYQVLQLSRGEKFIIGLSGGLGEIFFLYFLWLIVLRLFVKGKKEIDKIDNFIISCFINFPFLWVIFGTVLYAAEESTTYGMPF